MSMVSFIRDKLSQVFNPDQADVLSHVIVEAHDALATKADVHELRDVVKELAEAQRHTDQTVAELAEAQRRTDQTVAGLAEAQDRTNHTVAELAEAQRRTDQTVAGLAKAQDRISQTVAGLADAQDRISQTVAELVEAQRHTDQTVAGLAEAQRHTDKSMAELADSHRELAALQRAMLIRLDKTDGRMLEIFLRTHLPAYIGKHVRRCRIVEVQDVVEELEPLVATGTLAEADVDEFRRTDLLATGMLDGETIYLVGEVSRTGDNDDIYRAARRADILKRAGKKVMAVVACDLIGNAAAELARREGVSVLQGGSFLSAAG